MLINSKMMKILNNVAKMQLKSSRVIIEGFYVVFVAISINQRPFIADSSSVVTEVVNEHGPNILESNNLSSNETTRCLLQGDCSHRTPEHNDQHGQGINILQSNHKFSQDDSIDRLRYEPTELVLNTTNLQKANNGTDLYSKRERLIYSSLVKILYHMKQQLEKNQLKNQAHVSGSLQKESKPIKLNPRQADDVTPQTTTFDDDPTSDDPYVSINEQLSPFPSNTNAKVSTETTASRDTNGFSAPAEDQSNQSASSAFKPMVTVEVQNEPPIHSSNQNYLTGSVSTSSPDSLKPKRSTFSNQPVSILSNSNKRFNYILPGHHQMLQQQLQQQQQQQQPPQDQQQQLNASPSRFESSSSPQPWTNDKYNLLPSEEEISYNKPLFTFTSSDSGPNYDMPSETTNGGSLYSGQLYNNDQKKAHEDVAVTSGPQMQIEPEIDIYETLPPPPVTSKPRRRSRRSKSTTKQPAVQHFEKNSARFPRAPHFMSDSRDVMDQMDDDGGRERKLSALMSEIQEGGSSLSQTPRQDHTGVHLQQVYPINAQQSQPYPQPRAHNQQQALYTLSAAPSGMNLKGFVNSHFNNQMSSSVATPSHDSPTMGAASQQQRDLLNQPQTIQITAVPNVGVNQPLVRVNGQPLFGGLLGNNLYNNGYLDPFGRQVVMVNAERRQVDWSFWFWPILLAVTLPLVLGALFVPVFLKTIVMLIQVLQSLGLLLPLTNALTQQIAKASGVSTNQVEQIKT